MTPTNQDQVQEPCDLEGHGIAPGAHRREVGDRQVHDVERLVVGLVAGQRVVGERLEDRLMGGIDDQAGEEYGREREPGDQQRDGGNAARRDGDEDG